MDAGRSNAADGFVVAFSDPTSHVLQRLPARGAVSWMYARIDLGSDVVVGAASNGGRVSTRKYRFDPETGRLAPISITESERLELPPPVLFRALRLLFIVAALAVSATVFSMANGDDLPGAEELDR